MHEEVEELYDTVTVATLAYNDRRKKFSSYYSFTPNIYLTLKDSFLSFNQIYQQSDASLTMKLWNHNKLSSNFGEFYGVNHKSHIFIPFNEVPHNNKTLYSAVLNGTSLSAVDLEAKFYAVSVTGNKYILLDTPLDGTVDQKDDFYTLTPQGRLHGKSFVVKVSTLATNTSYVKINGVIARMRTESPKREMRGQQQMKKLMQQRKTK